MFLEMFPLLISLDSSIENSFNELPLDKPLKLTTGETTRFRRQSNYLMVYEAKEALIFPLPHKPFVQSAKHNLLHADQERNYDPLEIDPSLLIEIVADNLKLEKFICWEVGVHQIRITCEKGSQGRPVPEGPHQDGFRYVAIVVIHRENIKGGKTVIQSHEEGDLLFSATLPPKMVLAFDDRIVKHDTSPIETEEEFGLRDVFIFTFDDWSERRLAA